MIYSQLQPLVSDVISIVDVLVVLHSHDDSSSHGRDVDGLGSEVSVVDGDVSDNDRGESLDSLLEDWTTRTHDLPVDLDSSTDVVESLLACEDLGPEKREFQEEVSESGREEREDGDSTNIAASSRLTAKSEWKLSSFPQMSCRTSLSDWHPRALRAMTTGICKSEQRESGRATRRRRENELTSSWKEL